MTTIRDNSDIAPRALITLAGLAKREGVSKSLIRKRLREGRVFDKKGLPVMLHSTVENGMILLPDDVWIDKDRAVYASLKKKPLFRVGQWVKTLYCAEWVGGRITGRTDPKGITGRTEPKGSKSVLYTIQINFSRRARHHRGADPKAAFEIQTTPSNIRKADRKRG